MGSPFVFGQGPGVERFLRWALPMGSFAPVGTRVATAANPSESTWRRAIAKANARGHSCHLVQFVSGSIADPRAALARYDQQLESGEFDTISLADLRRGDHLRAPRPINARLLVGCSNLWRWDVDLMRTLPLHAMPDDEVRERELRRFLADPATTHQRAAIRLPESVTGETLRIIVGVAHRTWPSVEAFIAHRVLASGVGDYLLGDERVQRVVVAMTIRGR